MAYCTSTDVIAEFKSIDTTNGVVTTSKIDSWIAQADGLINGRIGTLYTTPITAAEPLLILKQVSIGLVAQRIARILEVKSITPKGDQYIPKDLIKEAKETLQMIVKQEIILAGADRNTTHAGVRSYTSDNDVDRVFDSTKDQW